MPRTVSRTWEMESSKSSKSYEIKEFSDNHTFVALKDMDVWVPKPGTRSKRDGTYVQRDVRIYGDFHVHRKAKKRLQTESTTVYNKSPQEYSWKEKNDGARP